MWDPAYNNSSAQQRSSDLTTRPATDRDTLHSTAIATFGAKQHTESATIEERYPAADVQLAGYTNHDSDISYQNGYPSLPSSQQQPNTGAADHVMRSSEEDIMPPPSLPLPREPFALGLSTTLLPITGTNTPISHNLQQRHTSNATNNIPLEIDTTTTNSSARPLSNSYPVWKHSDIQHKAQVQPITLVSPESYNLLPPPPHQDSTSEQQDQPSTPPAAGQPPLRLPSSLSTTSSLSKSPKSTRDTSPCIARLTIPPSHLSLFHDALTSPPDPDLKIRRKTVRFTKTSLTDSSPPPPSPRSEQRHERRESEGPRSNSTSGKASSSSSHHSSSKSTFSNSKPSSVPQIIEKDPEERMAELMELKQMKVRQEDLMHLKDQVFQTGQNLEEKQTILDEVRAERKVLHSELNRYIAMVKQVQKDLELAAEAETQLTKERDQLSQYLNQLRDHDFKVLKEEVDQLRAKKGLRPLQSLEQEQEEVMGRYLEERRGQWREDGVAPQDPSSSLPSSSLTNMNNSGSGSSLVDATAVDTSSRRQGAGSSSSSSGAAAAANSRSSRSHTSSTVAPAASRGKDKDGDSRSSRSHLSSSSSTRGRNHSSGKSKHEQSSSSSRHNNSMSSSRRQSSRSRSRSPVVSSSSSSRDERSKKRSRY